MDGRHLRSLIDPRLALRGGGRLEEVGRKDDERREDGDVAVDSQQNISMAMGSEACAGPLSAATP